jgi:hypothetical protein
MLKLNTRRFTEMVCTWMVCATAAATVTRSFCGRTLGEVVRPTFTSTQTGTESPAGKEESVCVGSKGTGYQPADSFAGGT